MSLQIINTVVTPQSIQNAEQVGNVSSIYKITGTFTTTSGAPLGTTATAVTTLNGSQQLSLPVNCIPIGATITNVGSSAATGTDTVSIVLSPDGTNPTNNVLLPAVNYVTLTAGTVLSSKPGAVTQVNATTTNLAKNVWFYLSATGAVVGTFNVTVFYTL